MKRAWLIFGALYEIARYEVIVALLGSGHILSQLKRQSIAAKPTSRELEQAICDAVLLATCFYWKPVLCLQRSAVATCLLLNGTTQNRDVRDRLGAARSAPACQRISTRIRRGRVQVIKDEAMVYLSLRGRADL